eukprot:scaffold143936_cov44-Attheya_sp.AAC.3
MSQVCSKAVFIQNGHDNRTFCTRIARTRQSPNRTKVGGKMSVEFRDKNPAHANGFVASYLICFIKSQPISLEAPSSACRTYSSLACSLFRVENVGSFLRELTTG